MGTSNQKATNSLMRMKAENAAPLRTYLDGCPYSASHEHAKPQTIRLLAPSILANMLDLCRSRGESSLPNYAFIALL